MKKIILIFFFLSFTKFIYSQTDLVTAPNREALQKKLDSAMCSSYYITAAEAEKILEKPVQLKDSSYKYAAGILRYTFDYIAKRIDSTSKGRIFFDFEQYKDIEIAKSIYQSIKTENEKSSILTIMKDMGDDAFLQKDELNEPFIIIRKGNKIFKLKVYVTTTQTSLDELVKVAKKIVSSH